MGNLPQEAFRNACGALLRFILARLSALTLASSRNNLFTVHRKGLLMLVRFVMEFLMLVKGCLGSRPALLVSFEPYGNVIQ